MTLCDCRSVCLGFLLSESTSGVSPVIFKQSVRNYLVDQICAKVNKFLFFSGDEVGELLHGCRAVARQRCGNGTIWAAALSGAHTTVSYLMPFLVRTTRVSYLVEVDYICCSPCVALEQPCQEYKCNNYTATKEVTE